MKELYVGDEDFGHSWDRYVDYQNTKDFLIQDRYLFKDNQIFMPQSSIKKQIIHELHGGGLRGHTSRDKANALVEEQYYW